MNTKLAIFTCTLLGLSALQTAIAQTMPTYLMLLDRLDRPRDGYCLDVLGSGGTFRPDLPLNAHNCKPGVAPDGVVTSQTDGKPYMPAFDLCVTAHGVNRASLAGAPVILHACGTDSPFFVTAGLQTWDLIAGGWVKLRGSNLCLAVGENANRTFSPSDSWRALSMQSCASYSPKLMQWRFVSRG